jgi:hypothetical protein
MDIVLKASPYILALIGGVGIVAIIATLLKRWEPRRKILTAALVVVVCGGVLLFMSRDKHIVVDDQGIHTNAYGRVSLTWSNVEKAMVVDSRAGSPYAPRMRTNGVSAGSYHVGWFKLADGTTAFAAIEIPDKALLIQANGTDYLFGPPEWDAFLAEVAKHVSIQKGEGSAQ